MPRKDVHADGEPRNDQTKSPSPESHGGEEQRDYTRNRNQCSQPEASQHQKQRQDARSVYESHGRFVTMPILHRPVGAGVFSQMAAWMTVATQTDATIRSVATTPRNTVPQRRSRWSADHAPTAVSVAANVANRTAIMAGNDRIDQAADKSTHAFSNAAQIAAPVECLVTCSTHWDGPRSVVLGRGTDPAHLAKTAFATYCIVNLAPTSWDCRSLEHFDAVQQQRRPIRHPYSLRLCCIAKHQEAGIGSVSPRHLATEQTLRRLSHESRPRAKPRDQCLPNPAVPANGQPPSRRRVRP